LSEDEAQGDGKHRPYILTGLTFQLLIEPLATKIDTTCILCYHGLHTTIRVNDHPIEGVAGEKFVSCTPN